MSGRRKQPQIVGIDTNIFIYHYHSNPAFVSKTNSFFNALAEGKYKAVISIITLVELLSFTAPENEIEKIQDAFHSTPNLIVLPVDLEIALKAANIRRTYGYRIPDATQLATALNAKADFFLTNDQRLNTFKQIEVKILRNLDSI